MLLLIAVLTFIATALGGFFAIRHQDKLHLILGFSAGAVIGVAFFDLMPETFELAGQHFGTGTVAGIIALGFLLYLILDRSLGHFHAHADEDHEGHGHHKGTLGAGSLSFHSFLDGIGIGLAFQASALVGAIVAAGVLAHDFSDGINTVSYILKSGGTKKRAYRFLFLDAAAPVLGILATLFFHVEEKILGLILALFCGFFLYIGASDLVPESHHAHPTYWTTLMTILGALVLFAAVHFIGV